MQLNELIDKEGIEAVSQKTNISVENLRYLYQQEFEKLNRVKALGFLKIFEREYDEIEIEGLRESIKEYYDAHKEPKDDEVVMVSQSMKESQGGFGFIKWLIMLGILYGIYHLYTIGALGNFSSSEKSMNKLSDQKALQSSVDEDVAKNIQVKEDETSGKIVEIETKATEVKQAVEPLEESTEKVVLTETNATVESISENNATTAQLPISDEPIQDTNKNNEKTDKIVETVKEKEEDNTTASIENLTINPTRGMLWYGFINIDTKQRREFMNKVSTPFELNGGRWILVTGHGYVDIVSEAKTIEIADRNKHYFYIDSNEIREIDRKEFRELNGGRGW